MMNPLQSLEIIFGNALGGSVKKEAHKVKAGSLRLRWAMIVGAMMACIVSLFTLVVLTLEEAAWHENQHQQSLLLVNSLSDELRIPMLANSDSEVTMIMDSFLRRVPSARSLELQWKGHELSQYGEPIAISVISNPIQLHGSSQRLNPLSLWYMGDIAYGQSHIGRVAVQFSVGSWQDLAWNIKTRLFLTAFVVVLISGFIVYWVAGRMSRPIELLAQAEQHVTQGNFNIRLPVLGNDEISAATRHFNRMVQELSHKERMRERMSRYLNPKLIEKLFAEDGDLSKSHHQEVTVLFADMINFTRYSQHASAETVINALNEHFELFHYIIDHFGGNVDKYIGDAVMAVFNHPFEDKEHVRHAVMAGLCMEEACKRLAIQRPDGGVIQFRIGLNQGDVIVGNIGARKRLEYTVIGDAVNVASRMAGLGAGVMASESVFEKLTYGFEMRDISEQQIKGIAEPIRCGSIVPITRKHMARVLEIVDAAMAAKALAEQEERYYENPTQDEVKT